MHVVRDRLELIEELPALRRVLVDVIAARALLRRRGWTNDLDGELLLRIHRQHLRLACGDLADHPVHSRRLGRPARSALRARREWTTKEGLPVVALAHGVGLRVAVTSLSRRQLRVRAQGLVLDLVGCLGLVVRWVQ
eukprot:1459339-Prymnesium_polylepis.1